VAALIVLAGWIYWQWSDQFTLDRLGEKQQVFREWMDRRPAVVIGGAFLVYVVVAGALIGSATAVSVFYGWLFGMVAGTLLVSFASTTAATLTFLLSRYVFREAVERRFRRQVQVIDEAFRANGNSYLLTLRLIPGIPFFMLNALMGLTPIRCWSYWWVSQLGMLPATLVFVYAGSVVPDLATLRDRGVSSIMTREVFGALLLLAMLPITLALFKRYRKLKKR
jgi:uncharacterized membrane protein YdjX (TVP38/TMEM64 family)